MGEGTVSEGHVAAVDALQLGGPDPLDNVFEDDLPWCSFWDDENGASLKTDHVHEARKVELDWFRDHGVYDRRKISECLQHAGAKPIRLLWVDTNKGDDAKENCRSGLVVREKRYTEEDGRALLATSLFCAMLLHEGIRMLGSLMVTLLRSKREKTVANASLGHVTCSFLRNGTT